VNVRRLLRSRRVPTTVAVVLVDRRTAERRFLVPDRRRLEARAPALDLAVLRPGSVLLLDGHFPDQALAAARRARALGATVIGDFHRPRPGLARLLRHVDHAVVPEEFVVASGERDPRRTLRALAERCRKTPVVTLGARGGIYLDAGRVRRFRAHPARVVDTTGAGDVFHGALAAGLAQGLVLAQALDLAACAAALACTALGGAGRLMTRDELRRWRRRATAPDRRGR
jgi:sulfofructose kinase